jgi:hypothetical protein
VKVALLHKEAKAAAALWCNKFQEHIRILPSKHRSGRKREENWRFHGTVTQATWMRKNAREKNSLASSCEKRWTLKARKQQVL